MITCHNDLTDDLGEAITNLGFMGLLYILGSQYMVISR